MSSDSPSGDKNSNHSVTPKKRFPSFWLLVAFIGYVFIGWSLKGIAFTWTLYAAIATLVFVIPAVAALAEFALVAIAYALSGVIIIGLFVLLTKVELSFLISLGIIWIALVAVPIAGDDLEKHKFNKWQAVAILFLACALGLALGMGLGLLVNRLVVQPPKVGLI